MVGLVLLSPVLLLAAKGDSKIKKGYVLKFSGFDLKGSSNTLFTLRAGAAYKGSLNSFEIAPQQTIVRSLVTYQKGNTTFIYPYKYKIVLPKFKVPEAPKF